MSIAGLDFEAQDALAIASIGAGATYAHWGLKRAGISSAQLLGAFRIKSNRVNQLVDPAGNRIKAYRSGILQYRSTQQQLENDAIDKITRRFNNQTLSGHELEARTALKESLSRPGMRHAFAGMHSQTFDTLSSMADQRTGSQLFDHIDNVLNMNVPGFRESFFESLHRKITDRNYKNDAGTLVDLNAGMFSPANTYANPQRVLRTGDVDRLSGFANLESFHRQLQTEGLVSGSFRDFTDTLTRQQRFFEVPTSGRNMATYARLRVQGTEFNYPLDANTMDVGGTGIQAPVYHPDRAGRNLSAFTGRFVDTSDLRNIKVRGWSEHIFGSAAEPGHRPLILDYIRRAASTGRSIQDLMIGIEDAENPDRFGQYFTNTAGGATVPIGKQTMVSIPGFHEAVQRSGSTNQEFLAHINRSLDATLDPIALASPGQVGKLASFHMRTQAVAAPGTQMNLMDYFSDIENLAATRRPLQALTEPWTYSEDSMARMRRHRVVMQNAAEIYNPVRSVITETPIYRAMLQTGMAPYVMPMMYSREGRSKSFGLAEGVMGLRESSLADMPTLMSQSKVHHIYRPKSAQDNAITYGAAHPKLVAGRGVGGADPSLLSIADRYMDDPVRRQEALRQALVGNNQWDENTLIGKRLDAAGGLVDERIKLGGSGHIRLTDIVAGKDQYKLIFQREQQFGTGSKTWGEMRNVGSPLMEGGSIMSDTSLNARLTGAGVHPSVAPHIQGVSEWTDTNRWGNYLRVRGQQISGLRMRLAGDTLGRAGAANNLSHLKGDAVRGPQINVLEKLMYSDFNDPGYEPVINRVRAHGFAMGQEVRSAMGRTGAHGDATLERARQYIVGRSTDASDTAYARQMDELMGTLRYSYQAGNLNAADLGSIFGFEAYQADDVPTGGSGRRMFGELGVMLQSPEARHAIAQQLEIGKPSTAWESGTDFLTRLETGLAGDYGIIGEATLHMRAATGQNISSHPKIERRAMEVLLNSADEGWASVVPGTRTIRDYLLEDIMTGLEIPDKEKVTQIQRIQEAYRVAKTAPAGGLSVAVGTTLNPISARMATMRGVGGGGYVDLSNYLNDLPMRIERDAVGVARPAPGPIYIPSQTTMDIVSPVLESTGAEHSVEAGYRSAHSNLQEAITQRESASMPNEIDVATRRLGMAVEGVRREEATMFFNKARSFMGGSVRHNVYTMVNAAENIMPLTASTTDAAGNVIARSTAGHGQVMFGNKQQIQDIFGGARKVMAGQHAELQYLDQLESQVMGGQYAAISLKLNPAITERGVNMVALGYNPAMDAAAPDRPVLAIGGRKIMVGGKEVNTYVTLAAKLSADADADEYAASLILGANKKEAHAFVNSDTNLKMLAESNDRHIQQYRAAEKVVGDSIDRNFEAAMSTIQRPNQLVPNITNLMGQSEIALLSHEMDTLKTMARLSMHTGDGATLSRSNYELLERLMYAMEQKGVSFKDVRAGMTPALAMTEDIRRITHATTLEEARTGFSSLLTKWAGPDIMTNGLSYTTTSGPETMRFSTDMLDQMTGLAAVNSPTFQAAQALVRTKSSKIREMTSQRLAELAEGLGGSGNEDMMVLSREIASELTGMIEQGTGRTMAENMITDINTSRLEAAARLRSVDFSKAWKPLAAGLAVAAVGYSLFDKGYSNKSLEAPPRPPGGESESGPSRSAIAMRVAMAQGAGLNLNEEFMNMRSDMGTGANTPMPMGNGMTGIPEAPRAIPVRSYVEGSAGRMNIQGMVPERVNISELAEQFRMSMPHNQVGVTVNHRYNMPRNLESKL